MNDERVVVVGSQLPPGDLRFTTTGGVFVTRCRTPHALALSTMDEVQEALEHLFAGQGVIVTITAREISWGDDDDPLITIRFAL